MHRPEEGEPLLADMYAEPRFYFVHSYHAVCGDPADVLTSTFHGTSSPRRSSTAASSASVPPEKSHKFGMRLLKNFAEARHADDKGDPCSCSGTRVS